MLDLEIEGIKIPGQGAVVVKDEHCTHPLIIEINVMTACCDALFIWPGKSALSSQRLKNQTVWQDAFAS